VKFSDYTGFPGKLMDGRVKTLHPKVHVGILGRVTSTAPFMKEHGIEENWLWLWFKPISFEATIERPRLRSFQWRLKTSTSAALLWFALRAKNHKRRSYRCIHQQKALTVYFASLKRMAAFTYDQRFWFLPYKPSSTHSHLRRRDCQLSRQKKSKRAARFRSLHSICN